MLTASILSRIIYILIGAAVVGIFALILVLIMKKGNKKFDEAVAKVPQEDLDKIQNTEYQNHPDKPGCYIALAVITTVGKVMQDKVKLEVIFYNNGPQQLMLDDAVVDKTLFEQKGMKEGSLVQVTLKQGEAILRTQEVI